MDSATIADRLLSEQHVALAPGATIGSIAGKYVRVSMAAEDKTIIGGLKRACAFIKAHS